MSIIMTIALGAVATVLLLGLWNMMRGGPGNRSQMLMRWRVILQFAAIIAMLGALWFTQR
jgi:Hypoxia induced protein conserved region